MPLTVSISHLPGGYAETSGLAGDEIAICTRKFVSTEDGSLLIKLLEGFPVQILNLLPSNLHINASLIDNFLAIIHPSKEVVVFINELRTRVTVRAKRAVRAGEEVTLDDFIDVEDVKFEGVSIPSECGFFYIFSRGWRKGMFFDFSPIADPDKPEIRNYDLGKMLAECYAQLVFQERVFLSEIAWDTFFTQQWFPFAHLHHATLLKLVRSAESQHPLDEHLQIIVTELAKDISDWLEGAKIREFLQPHMAALQCAADRFKAQDYLSTSALLYPRIEGVLRTVHLKESNSQASQTNLAKTGAGAHLPPKHAASLLLPTKFQKYLKEIYFASFDPLNPQGVSRNTVGHGVAPIEQMNSKAAVIAWLTIMQISALVVDG